MSATVTSKEGMSIAAAVATWCLVIGLSGPRTVSAQATEPSASDEPVVAAAVTAAASVPDMERSILPVAFHKTVPESVDDLRSMETHVQSLVAKLTETTVALTVKNAQGSGVIVSEDGYVLTAAHVSGPPGHKVSVRLADGTRAYGWSLGRNKTLDASLIKIESPKRKWPYVSMARREEVGVGDWSIVMGHPGGYQKGRPPVFRLGRVIRVDERVIQTDNELVGGDSGGPLFDMHGRVIGINSRIGPSTSFNLHTPINAYTDFWDRLIASEEFILHSGALLGVRGEQDEQGLKLTKVWPEEPAGRVGIQEGDILLTFQAQRVRSLQHLVELVGTTRPGRRVTLTVLRGDELLEFTPRLGRKQSVDE